MTSTGIVTVINALPFSTTQLISLPSGLIQATDGYLYGFSAGGVFKMDVSGNVLQFSSVPGSVQGLFQASDGNFYGTYVNGQASCNASTSQGCGSVFSMNPSGGVMTLYSFSGQPNDGAVPMGVLIQGLDGNLYGTTASGGQANDGTIFQVSGIGTAAPPTPVVNPGGVVNAASNATGPVAPGSIALGYGNFLVTSLVVSAGPQWPTSLGGVSMQFGGVQTPLYFVSNAQVSFQVPWEITGKPQAMLTATVGGQPAFHRRSTLRLLLPAFSA